VTCVARREIGKSTSKFSGVAVPSGLFDGPIRFMFQQERRCWSAIEQQLNELIADGWEVVSANASSYGLFVFGCGNQEPVVTFNLRRPRQS
jgi:hypothetical protein